MTATDVYEMGLPEHAPAPVRRVKRWDLTAATGTKGTDIEQRYYWHHYRLGVRLRRRYRP